MMHADEAVKEEPLAFFVYGTLMSGMPNERLLGRDAYRTPATVGKFVLLDNGWFPYAVCTQQSSDVIVGEVMLVKPEQYAKVLADLDRLEGCNPSSSQNHYNRIVVQASCEDGSLIEAWCYVPGAHVSKEHLLSLPVVPGGDWRLLDKERAEAEPTRSLR